MHIFTLCKCNIAPLIIDRHWLGTVWYRHATSYYQTQYPCRHMHYGDVVMCVVASLITSLTIVYSIVFSGADKKKTSKRRVTGLWAGNSLGTGEFPAQMASNAENVSIWWRHHGLYQATVNNHTYERFEQRISTTIWGGWGCAVSCGRHHRLRGKNTTGSALDGAVFDIAQILACLVHNMSRSQVYLGFGHFGWLPSFFGQ